MPKTIKENEGELRYSLNTEKLDPVSNQPYWTLPPPLVSLIDAVPPEYEDIRWGANHLLRNNMFFYGSPHDKRFQLTEVVSKSHGKYE